MKQYVIYKHPKDFPNSYVVRTFEIVPKEVKPTDQFAVAKTLKELRALIPPQCIAIARDPTDDPCIVEVWI